MDETQYKQEILVFQLMKAVSLKHHIWRYQVHDHKRNIKRLVKIVPHCKSLPRPLAYPLKKTGQTAVPVAILNGKIPSSETSYVSRLFRSTYISFQLLI